MKRLLIATLISVCMIMTAAAQSESKPVKPRSHRRLFVASIIAAAGGLSLDAASSVGMRALNPVIGRGAFGPRQAAFGVGISGTAIVTGWLLVRHRPERESTVIVCNFGLAAMHGAIAARNYGIR